MKQFLTKRGINTAIVMILVATASLALDGCGRKEKLTPPPGSDYPRQYPRE